MPRRNIANGYYALRWKILERDNFTCRTCGQKAPTVVLAVDHIISVAEGGNDHPDNLRTLCSACNLGRSALSIIIKRHRRECKPWEGRQDIIPQSFRQDQMLGLVKEAINGITTKELGMKVNISRGAIDMTLHRLKHKELIIRKNSRWFVAG